MHETGIIRQSKSPAGSPILFVPKAHGRGLRLCVDYIDDVLIYAKMEEKHDLLVKEVWKRLAENDLVISPEKYIWSSERVEFLGYIIIRDGMEMSEDKIEAIKEWQAPKPLRDVQSFLGFANFYRRFIKDFSRVCRRLTESTKGE
jgi:hypothetical protein